MMMGGFGGYGSFGWIGMIIHLVITLGVIIGLILLVVWAVRRISGTTNTQSTYKPSVEQSAKEIAQLRYARGEISRDEFQQILADLN